MSTAGQLRKAQARIAHLMAADEARHATGIAALAALEEIRLALDLPAEATRERIVEAVQCTVKRAADVRASLCRLQSHSDMLGRIAAEVADYCDHPHCTTEDAVRHVLAEVRRLRAVLADINAIAKLHPDESGREDFETLEVIADKSHNEKVSDGGEVQHG